MATINAVIRDGISDAVAQLVDDINDHDLPRPWIIGRLTVTPDRDNPGSWAVRAFGGRGSESSEWHYAAYVTVNGTVIMDAS